MMMRLAGSEAAASSSCAPLATLFTEAGLLRMGIDKKLTIPIPLSILLIDPIPYRFSYRLSLVEGISANLFVCINSL